MVMTTRAQNQAKSAKDGKIQNARGLLQKYGVDHEALTDEEVLDKIAKISEIQESSVQILHRGPVTAALELALSHLPDGVRGGFIKNDDISIDRAKALGWEVFINEDAAAETPTPAADNSVRVGDLLMVFMSEDAYIARQLAKEANHLNKRDARAMKVGKTGRTRGHKDPSMIDVMEMDT